MPIPPFLQSIHSLISWFLGLCTDSAKARQRCGWLGRGCERRGADRGPRRREGGGDGAGSGSRRAALGSLQHAPRQQLSADALAPARGCRTPLRGVSRTPQRGGSGRTALEQSPRTVPPGSGAQRWVSKLGRGQLRTPSPRGALLVLGPRTLGKGGPGGIGDLGSPWKHRGL